MQNKDFAESIAWDLLLQNEVQGTSQGTLDDFFDIEPSAWKVHYNLDDICIDKGDWHTPGEHTVAGVIEVWDPDGVRYEFEVKNHYELESVAS